MHDHSQHGRGETPEPSFWSSRGAFVLLGFIAIAGFMLVSEHRAHVLGALPFLFLLACPLMHVFMHGGHGSHGSHGDDRQVDPDRKKGDRP
ncbi:MAG: DUF2933 domain-containing protein [Hyphomicrobiaceae bacterium]